MRYIDVKVGEVFFFEDNFEYPKRKTAYGHIDLRDDATGYMPDDIPVFTAHDIEYLIETVGMVQPAIENFKDIVTGQPVKEEYRQLLYRASERFAIVPGRE